MQDDGGDYVPEGVSGSEREKKYTDLQNRRRRDNGSLQSTYIPFLI